MVNPVSASLLSVQARSMAEEDIAVADRPEGAFRVLQDPRQNIMLGPEALISRMA